MKESPPDDRWTPWRPAALSKAEYVSLAGSLDYVRGLASNPATGPNPNLPAFANEGGLLDKGVCWWHSRLVRAALYLAYFEPTAPRPGPREARRIIARLMAAREVVAIPGFSGFREFTLENRALVLKKLAAMQLSDGILRFQWVNGLAGRSEVRADIMRKQVEKISRQVSEVGLAYVKLQIPGIDAHSWIVTETAPGRGGGLLLRFLDSNYEGASVWEYRPGQTKIAAGMPGDFGVPYLQRSGELEGMKRAIARFAANPG